MNVDAPMWSACTTGLGPENCGASDGAAAACCAFHLSTSARISSLSAERSITACSTVLNRPMISDFTFARSPSGSPASRRRSMSAYRSRSPASVSSAIRGGPGHSLFEYDAFTRREQLRDVQDDDHRFFLRLRAHE